MCVVGGVDVVDAAVVVVADGCVSVVIVGVVVDVVVTVAVGWCCCECGV